MGGGGVIDINDQLWGGLGIQIWREIDFASEVICIQFSMYYKSTFYFAHHLIFLSFIKEINMLKVFSSISCFQINLWKQSTPQTQTSFLQNAPVCNVLHTFTINSGYMYYSTWANFVPAAHGRHLQGSYTPYYPQELCE